jgi:hypothetical protein
VIEKGCLGSLFLLYFFVYVFLNVDHLALKILQKGHELYGLEIGGGPKKYGHPKMATL